MDEFWQKVNDSLGDYKNVKTHGQCMSLIEKTEFIFFISLLSGFAENVNSHCYKSRFHNRNKRFFFLKILISDFDFRFCQRIQRHTHESNLNLPIFLSSLSIKPNVKVLDFLIHSHSQDIYQESHTQKSETFYVVFRQH